MLKVTIATLDPDMANIFHDMFIDEEYVSIELGSALDISADAIVSPANSFGIMDGGFDGKIIDKLGSTVQTKVRAIVNRYYYGEIPVGQCLVARIDQGGYKFLLGAPTMRTPKNVSQTDNAYTAFRAMLIAAKQSSNIDSVSCPVFCTGTGRMDPYVAATQMKMAYRNVMHGMRLDDWDSIQKSEVKMLSPDFT